MIKYFHAVLAVVLRRVLYPEFYNLEGQCFGICLLFAGASLERHARRIVDVQSARCEEKASKTAVSAKRGKMITAPLFVRTEIFPGATRSYA
jgi:hypothetical protein